MRNYDLLQKSLELLPQGITIMNKQGRIVYANKKANELIGLNINLNGSNSQEVIRRFVILSETGRRLANSELPNRIALSTGRPQSAVLRFKKIRGSTESWSWVHSTPVKNSANQVEFVISTFHNIYEHKKTELTLQLLNQLNIQLLSEENYMEGLKRFASLVVPIVADWCAIDQLDDNNNLVQVALSHVDARKIPLASELRQKYPPNPNDTSGVWNVIRTGKTEIYPHITQQQLVSNTRDKYQLTLLKQLELRSIIIAPLKARNKIFGVITFAHAESGRNFKQRDLLFIEDIVHRAALLLDNARLYATASDLILKQVKTLESLIESENTLRLALETGQMGIWDYHIQNDHITWSNGLGPLHNLRTGHNHGSLEDFLSHIIPDDRLRVAKKLKFAINKSGHFDEEFRISSPNYKYRLMHKIGEVLKDSNQQPVRLLGIGTDITEQKLANDKIRQSENKFRSIFDGTQDIIVIVDDQIKITDINPSGIKFFKSQKSKIIGKIFANLIGQNRKDFYSTWRKLQQRKTLRGIVEISSKDSHKYMLEYNANAQFLPGQTLFAMRDVTKRIEEENRRQHLVSIVSHELRTPITSIKVFTDLLRLRFKNTSDEKILNYLTKIDEKSNNLTDLISDLLDLARIDAGTLEFSYEMFDFDDFIKQYLSEARLMIVSHKISVRGKTGQTIVTDKIRLTQVFNNLIRNAAKYSANSDKIVVKLSAVDDWITICIQDFGIGIPKIDQTKIFNLYYRSQQSSSHASGLGVGLYITSQIIKKMGGKIWVKSKAGSGSSFFINIPVNPK